MHFEEQKQGKRRRKYGESTVDTMQSGLKMVGSHSKKVICFMNQRKTVLCDCTVSNILPKTLISTLNIIYVDA